MVRESYQKELRRLREGIIELSVKVHRQMEQGLQSLLDHDMAIAQKLDEYDDQIDRQSLELEKKCFDLLALQQPVAVDLRLITSSSKIATDLERVGDLAVNLGEYAQDSERITGISWGDLETAGKIALEMFAESVQAFEFKDVERAKAVILKDDELDEACWNIIRNFLAHLMEVQMERTSEAEAEENASQALSVLLSTRDLERVGDHAANIAARVIYMVSGREEYI